MEIFHGLPAPENRIDCALAIGNFDGVHLGHQVLLKEVVQAARSRYLCPAVLTFEPHPREVFSPQTAPARVLSQQDKAQAIADCGLERLYILPFDAKLAALSPEGFVKDILVDGLHTRWLTVGDNFRFGRQRGAGIQELEQFGRQMGFEVHPMPLLFHKQTAISSSRIRQALAAGDIASVNTMLGRPYMISGEVLHGKQLGRTLGFPTLNQRILPPGSLARPAVQGVWAVKVHGIGPRPYEAVACVGQRPTVDEQGQYLLETHIFDYTGDLYGKNLQVEFFHKIRDEKKFNSLEELRLAVEADKATARELLGLSKTRKSTD